MKKTKNKRLIIRDGWVVSSGQVQKKTIAVENRQITLVENDIPIENDDKIIEASDKYILPGFIDIHNHGATGFDFSFGTYDLAQDEFKHEAESFRNGLRSACDFYTKSGVTRVLPTTMAAPLDYLLKSLDHLKSLIEEDPLTGSIIGGVNIEGTFLVDPAYAGAQNPKFFYPLSDEILNQLIDVAGNLIRVVNIPPEHGVEALPFISQLRDQGTVVAAGHTNAYGNMVAAAAEAGLRLGVHFLNGPARSSSKSFHQGGAEEMMLKHDDISLEIIGDGYHVDPSYVRDIIARKGLKKVIIVTDSMFANGLYDLKRFTMFGLQGAVSQNREYLQMLNAEDTLFGSVLRSDVAFANLVKWLSSEIPGVWHRQHQAMSRDDAVIAASTMMSENPARLLGLFNHSNIDPGTGSIVPGKWADIIIGHFTSNECFQIDHTLVKGNLMVSASSGLLVSSTQHG